MKKKNFDPLKELREIREKLSVRYWNNPQSLKKDIESIRNNYQLKKPASNLSKISKAI